MTKGKQYREMSFECYWFIGTSDMKGMVLKMKKIFRATAILLIVLILSGCNTASSGNISEELSLNAESKEATEDTVKINSALYSLLDFEDTQEADFAVKGLIDAPESLQLTDDDGNVIWEQSAYEFLDDYEKAPDTVNPSLWENTKNNHAYGLFEVTDGIYQVRGYDMSNLTVIEGDTGWIVFDPLMSVECSEAAMQLIEKISAHDRSKP